MKLATLLCRQSSFEEPSTDYAEFNLRDLWILFC